MQSKLFTTSEPVRVLERRSLPPAGSYPAARLTFALPGDGERVLFCKYEEGPPGHGAHRHRGGVRYEARVYDELLGDLPLSTLKSYGLCQDPDNGRTFLALEYVEAALRVNQVSRHAITAAARWIGAFHASWDSERECLPRLLFRYDLDYYCGWAERAACFADPLKRAYPWLGEVTSSFRGIAARLVEQPATVIHGEFYPKNVLYHAGQIYPIDWESAAVAAGEIDLAALTEKWDDRTVERCLLAYRRARWARDPGRDRLLLDEARLYLALRWLGHDRTWTEHPGARAMFDDVRSSAGRLGII